MRTSPGIVFAVLAGLIATGCSSTAATAVPTTAAVTAAPTAPPTATLPPTPSPEPTIDLAPVAAAYLAMSNALIAANEAALAVLNSATSDAEAAPGYQMFADADGVAIAAVQAITFPPDLQDEVASFMAALEKHQAAMAQLAADPSDVDPTIQDRLNEAAAESRAAASAIRAALGLPPPATPAP
ncbi:MAG TPA: hypothetical protein VEX41_07270 [Candidatus Eisenbacteria bacterium]|nr:hypothetical protein [Candidatus Eisenbacteria bacterium]